MNDITQLRIQGMHCAACVSAIERSVGELEGVSRASVNFATERLSVDYDPKRAGLSRIEAVVSSAGAYRLISSGTENRDADAVAADYREDPFPSPEAHQPAPRQASLAGLRGFQPPPRPGAEFAADRGARILGGGERERGAPEAVRSFQRLGDFEQARHNTEV